jgi:uncharacterized protein
MHPFAAQKDEERQHSKMIEQFVDSKTCLRCQGCCRFKEIDSAWGPAFLKEETASAKAHHLLLEAIGKNNKLKLKKAAGQECFVCHFLDLKDNSCGIYAFRPFECQLYPFLINLDQGRIYLSVDPGCPFVQEHLDSALLKTHASRLFEFLDTKECRAMLKNNPQIIQAYGNLLNLFELKLD